MSSLSYRSSASDRWSQPKGTGDASLRRQIHGPIQPMQRPGFFARLLGAR